MEPAKRKYHRAAAIEVAREICNTLKPITDSLMVAGSLRRRRPMVSDIEILFIPKWGEEKDGLFDVREFSIVDRQLDRWLAEGVLAKRPNVAGSFTWGAQNKLGIHVLSGIPVDFFATDAARWWVALVIRTGGKEMNLQLTTGAQKLGRTLHAYGRGFTDVDGGELVCHSEEDVFKYAGVTYREPWER